MYMKNKQSPGECYNYIAFVGWRLFFLFKIKNKDILY